MPVPKSLSSFDIDKSTLTLWLFKKAPQAGGLPPKYAGLWIDTHESLERQLKAAVAAERARVTETGEYGLLAQVNEGSALTIDAMETHAHLILAQAAAELPGRKVKDMKQIQNTAFYVIKLSHGKKVLYGVRKTEGSWQTKRMKDAIYAFFTNNRLGLDDKPSFRISRLVDFFIADDQILISHKGHFESILNYKAAHVEDFQALQQESKFKALFSSLEPFVQFVGAHKIHLRRACAIREKGHYKDAKFMARLRQHHAQYKLVLNFDADGRVVPTEETCADIIRALLDHRLRSPFSEQNYDVPDATVVH